MLWVAITLSCALSVAIQDALSKKAAGEIGTIIVSALRLWAAVPFLIIIFLFIDIPELSIDFFIVVGLLLPLDIIALVLYVRAIQISPLSLTLPFLSLSPLFVIITGYLVLGETINPWGVVGILLIAIGAYLINIHSAKDGITQPILSIGREKGSLMMIGVTLIYGITAVLGKKALLLSTPEFFAPFYLTLFSVAMLPVVLALGPGTVETTRRIRGNIGIVILIGITGALHFAFHFWAISMVEAAYMVSVKRSSLLFGIILGRLFFQETYFGERLLAGGLMIIGVFLISLS